MLKVPALDALRNPHQIRVVLLLEARGPMRFNQIQRALKLNPAQVDRALKFLDEAFWVMATTIPGTLRDNGILVDYRLTHRGTALAKAIRAFVRSYDRATARFPRDGESLASLVSA